MRQIQPALVPEQPRSKADKRPHCRSRWRRPRKLAPWLGIFGFAHSRVDLTCFVHRPSAPAAKMRCNWFRCSHGKKKGWILLDPPLRSSQRTWLTGTKPPAPSPWPQPSGHRRTPRRPFHPAGTGRMRVDRSDRGRTVRSGSPFLHRSPWP